MARFRALVLSFLMIAVAANAQARTYWVSPTGTSGAAGNDTLSTPTTLAWFNANAAAGDVCRFKSGTYTDPIYPARDGNSTSRIRYYGFPQDPSAVVVADIRFGYQHGNYCTARWVSCANGATGLYEAGATEATDDSLVACWITGQTGPFTIGSKRSVVDSLRITGTITSTAQTHFIAINGERDHANGPIGEWSIGSLNNRFTNSTVNVNVNTTASAGDVHIIQMSASAYNTVANNTFNVTITNCYGYFFGIEQYEGYYNQFTNNAFSIALNGSIGGSHGVWCHRDSSSYNRYVGNSVNVTGSGAGLSFMLSNGGSFPNTTGHNYYGNNYINVHSPQAGTGVFWWYDGTRSDTLEYNTIITDSSTPLLNVPSGQSIDGTVLRHNTYYTGGATAVNFSPATALNNPRFSSEVFYCRAASGSGSEVIRVPSGVGVDSAGVFFSPTSSNGNTAIWYGGTDGAPGSGGSFGIAGKSVWGSPRFVDSTYATFDGRLGSNSLAVNSNFTDGFSGAYPAAGTDVTPPATVSNLAASQPTQTSLLLGWTAPGDNGTTGTAALYDMRWSGAPITTSNFGAATPVSPQPVPAAGGTAQTYLMTGLTQGTTYYFALRARDAAGNWSGVSNVAMGTTTPDTIPPAAVQDLSTNP